MPRGGDDGAGQQARDVAVGQRRGHGVCVPGRWFLVTIEAMAASAAGAGGFAVGMVRDLHGCHTALTCLDAAEAALRASSVPVVCLPAAAMTRRRA